MLGLLPGSCRTTQFLGLALLQVTVAAAAAPRLPFPQEATYAPGTLAPSNHTLAELHDDVRAAYWRWKASYLARAGTEPDGHPRYRVKLGTDPGEATVSEGQGYGMIIVAFMAGEDSDAQEIFDGLWEYFNDHRSEIDPRLMDWHVPADETPEPGSDDSAFDGDCDIAYALLLAEQQWGSAGRIDYRFSRDSILTGLAQSTIGPESHLPMLGDWVDPNGMTYNQHTPRSSDLIVGHFRAFGRATGDPLWSQVADASQACVESLQASHSPTTGLLPDFIVPTSPTDPTPQPAPPDFLEGEHDGEYYYNAGRDPWRLGLDALLDNDATAADQTLRMAQWIRASTGGEPQAIMAGYQLDGTPIGAYFTSFFAAPFGVAAMVDPAAQQWLNAVYDSIRTAEEGYFEDTVTLLAMLVMARTWWDPTRGLFSDGFESGDTSSWSAAVP